LPPSIAASPGKSCQRINEFRQVKKIVLICIKSNNKKVWTKAKGKQLKKYEILKIQKISEERRENLSSLIKLQNELANPQIYIQQIDSALVTSKKSLIEGKRKIVADLQTTLDVEKMNNTSLTTRFDEITSSLTSTQSRVASIQSQINSQQSIVNAAKVNNDVAYNSYLAAKVTSDSLSYAYQRALNDNAAMLSAKVLCDFGFGSCGIYNSFQYSMNASTISQYNNAISRTSSAYATWTNYNARYTSELASLNLLRSQLTEANNLYNSQNSQRNVLKQNLDISTAKVVSLATQLKNAQVDLVKYEEADKRILEDTFIHSEKVKEFLSLAQELNNSIQNLVDVSTDEFIRSASTEIWNPKLEEISETQLKFDTVREEIRNVALELSAYLARLT
jgi:hypothetical protein